MTRHPFPPSLVMLAAALVVAAPVTAQQSTPSAGQTDADALATQMRVIAARPADVDALARAGELSARLGDLSGAASLFARADKADPRNGRVKAGMAEVLLRSERPGEALQYYNQAEGYGYPVARFAAERGLAYDLVGQQGRAQRDYRVALAAGGADAEVTRRYALSLGIAGQGEAGLQQLEPLTRRNDRAAWRARAFILAMRGDVAEANTIATTMMLPGQAQGLAPFFARLGTLGAVDRAFAVQFGEVRPTPQRLADARLAPALPPLAPEIVPVARVAVASMPAAAAKPGRGADRRRSRDAIEVAARPAAPAVAPATQPAASAVSTPVQVAAVPARRAPPSRVAIYDPGSMLPRYVLRPATGASPPARTPMAAPAATGAGLAMPTASPPGSPNVPAASPPAVAATSPALRPVPQTLPGPTPASMASAQLASAEPQPRPTPVVSTVPAVPVPATDRPADPVATSTEPAHAAIAQVPPPAAPDAVLARIVDALTIPGRELAEAGARAPAEAAAASVAPAVRSDPVTTATLATVERRTIVPPSTNARRATARETLVAEVAPPRAGRREPAAVTADDIPASTRRGRRGVRVAGGDATVTQAAAAPEEPPASRHDRRGARATADEANVASTAAEDSPASLRRGRRAARAAEEAGTTASPAEETPAERRAAARQAAADRKAVADRKAAVAARAQADREAAEEKRAARAEPRRYWVQVAGGANEGDLPKAWASAKGKADALGGRKAWSTPLRATNRVLAGPFKSDDEARSFVNTLKKQGLPAFQFTSEAGQKITRLDAK